MTETATVTPEPQRLQALGQANEIRLARAALKRRIASGGASAAQVILECPREARSWSVGDLLMSQRRWGQTRCRRFLVQNEISEVKRIGSLTDRQRQMLASRLANSDGDGPAVAVRAPTPTPPAAPRTAVATPSSIVPPIERHAGRELVLAGV